MFQLRCPVRACSNLLEQQDNQLRCAAGHHFDRAKQGYWPLLQPQDRRSLKAGDCDAAVDARQRWLSGGYAAGLIEALKPWVAATRQGETGVVRSRTIDLGCGEGSFGPALFGDEAEGFCGIDLSKRAIKLAARGWPAATWVLANADRVLPISDTSVDRVVSLFGRRPASEIQRVLVPGGHCIVAVPGEDDLIELREKVQQVGHRRSRWRLVVEELSEAGLELIEHETWRQCVDLDAAAILDALAMTYRGVRHSQQARLESIVAMNVTLSADLMLLRRNPPSVDNG